MIVSNWCYTALIFISAIFLFSCQKEAGEGGNSSIYGKVKVQKYTNGFYIGEYYAQEERVYIVYGDNNVYDDDMRTSYDGSFRFDYLYPGKYTIFCYSQCDTCLSNNEVVSQEVNITDKGQMLEIPEFVIKDL